MTQKTGIISNALRAATAGITVNSVMRRETAEIAEMRNIKGKVTDLAAYSCGETITVKGVVDEAGGEIVRAGAVLELDAGSYLIVSVDKPESGSGEVTIVARAADGANLTGVPATPPEA
ncbi:hypothetical protein [Victivallis vadensis]|uniref:hypothetical protein n=1 Tax=Victivallis vadensis TaxID=172901 RepID=UPI000D799D95|nr:hypothetical protein [Victivallis vadensis]PWM80345.1 MAG: hypothetical protein DBX90_08650 [Lentisphaerota bacterium]